MITLGTLRLYLQAIRNAVIYPPIEVVYCDCGKSVYKGVYCADCWDMITSGWGY